MKTLSLIILLLGTLTAFQAQAASAVLGLKTGEMRELKLDSIPPWPAERVLKGTSEHALKVLHKGEFVVTVYAAEPALIDIYAGGQTVALEKKWTLDSDRRQKEDR